MPSIAAVAVNVPFAQETCELHFYCNLLRAHSLLGVLCQAGTSPAPWDARDEPSASHHFPLGESPHLRQNNGSAAGFSFPHLPVPGSVAEPEAGARASEAGSAGSSRLRLRGRDGKEVGARDAETQVLPCPLLLYRRALKCV